MALARVTGSGHMLDRHVKSSHQAPVMSARLKVGLFHKLLLIKSCAVCILNSFKTHNNVGYLQSIIK